MILDKRIFATGTMRTGGSLLINILSLHSKIVVFNERINFFRFVYGRYDPLTPKSIDRMLNHHRIRMKHRTNTEFETEHVLEAILRRGIDGASCYEELMQSLLRPTNKEIWGEYANLSWRYIPEFLRMFPNGKVIHVCRDPRGVLASFGKLSFMPDNLYLNAIFNWIDSVNHIKRYRDTISSKCYMVVRFEDLHLKPEKTIRDLCDFLEVDFEDIMIRSDEWRERIDENIVKVNISAHTKNKVYGFDIKRIETWKNSLDDWEVALCDHLTQGLLEYMGYKLSEKKIDSVDLNYGLALLKGQRYLSETLERFLDSGNGVDEHPVDPRDPTNWSAPGDGFKRFIDTPAYDAYVEEMNKLEDDLREKHE